MAFNGRFILNLVHFASKVGVNSKELIKLSEMDENQLCKEDCIVEDEIYNKVVTRAIELTQDPFYGLHAGENLNLSAAGLIAQLTQTSETVKQAIELCCEFANLGCSALPMQLIEDTEYYKLMLIPNDLWRKKSELVFQHTTEGVLAFFIKEFHSLTRLKYNPRAIYLDWKNDKELKEYERVLNCPVYFNKSEIAILLEKEHVEAKVITSDYNLLRILVKHAEEKSASITKEQGFSALVKDSVIKLVKPEFPTIEQVANHLNVSLRTLQRRLKEEGVTFKQLIDELRKDFAISYLRRKDLSIGDVSYLLNYNDISAFTRSFKRWTGVTPKVFRESI